MRHPGCRISRPKRGIGRRRLTPRGTDFIIPTLTGEASAFPDLFWKSHQEFSACHHIRNENIPPAGGTAGVRTTQCFRPALSAAPIAARKSPPTPSVRNAAITPAGRCSSRRKRPKRRNNRPGVPQKAVQVRPFFFRNPGDGSVLVKAITSFGLRIAPVVRLLPG